MKPFGRIPLCGMISTYNAVTPPPGPNNLMLMVAKRLTMRGFLVGDHADRKQGRYAHSTIGHRAGSRSRRKAT
jgi:NADPH-dependent curcumin reductase CurA